MIALRLFPHADGMLEGDTDRLVVVDQPVRIGALAHGMESGKPSVGIALELPDGRIALGETSLALFLAAADTLKAVHGDPRT